MICTHDLVFVNKEITKSSKLTSSCTHAIFIMQDEPLTRTYEGTKPKWGMGVSSFQAHYLQRTERPPSDNNYLHGGPWVRFLNYDTRTASGSNTGSVHLTFSF